MSSLSIPPELVHEIIAKLDPSEWERMEDTLPYLNWKEITRIANIQNPLILFNRAVFEGNAFLVKLLIDYCSIDLSKDGNNAINIACEYGNTKVVQVLLRDPRVTPSNRALRVACSNNYLGIVKLLLEDGRADPNDGIKNALELSCFNGNVEVVKLLLQDPRVDPGRDDNYALKMASVYGHEEVVKLLLSDPRVDPTAEENFALHNAVADGHVEVVKVLLSDPRVARNRDIEGLIGQAERKRIKKRNLY